MHYTLRSGALQWGRDHRASARPRARRWTRALTGLLRVEPLPARARVDVNQRAVRTSWPTKPHTEAQLASKGERTTVRPGWLMGMTW